MRLRKLFCLSYLVVCSLHVFSQSAIVSGGGDVFISGDGGLSASVGQIDYEYVSNREGESLSTGVQHSFVEPDTETGSSLFSDKFVSIFIAPNPTSDFCNVVVEGYDVAYLDFTVCDLAGRVLKNQALDSKNRVSFGDFPKGVYLLRVTSEKTGTNVIFKIIKE